LKNWNGLSGSARSTAATICPSRSRSPSPSLNPTTVGSAATDTAEAGSKMTLPRW
jgi:hypothetical protein